MEQEIRKYFVIHGGLLLLGSLMIAVLLGTKLSAFFFFGGLLGALNIYALVIVLKRILDKKSVALPLSVIVSKYAVLGIILYQVTKLEKSLCLFFVIGLSLIVPATVIFGLFYLNSKEKES